MGNTKFQQGVTISATSFVDDESFNVQVVSSRAFADGGTAKIFLGRVDQTWALVALKLFVLNMAEYEEQLLNRELRAARRIQHPHILPYTGTAIFEFHKIIISPYMENGNLIQYLAKRTTADRYPLILQVGTAVEFLHVVHKLVHGDIKCENVLVSDEGDALLADFGLSTYIDKTDASTTTASALRMQLSIQFAAPELLFGETARIPGQQTRPARKTPQTDVYAFGMMILQAFSGRPPWPEHKTPEIVVKVHSRTIHPRPVYKEPPGGLCDEWWDGCVACWEYDPSSRPTITKLWTMLRSCISNQPEETRNGKRDPNLSGSGSSIEAGIDSAPRLRRVKRPGQSSASNIGAVYATVSPDGDRRIWAIYIPDGTASTDGPLALERRRRLGCTWWTQAFAPLRREPHIQQPRVSQTGGPFSFDPRTHAFSLRSPHEVLHEQQLYPCAAYLFYALMFPTLATFGEKVHSWDELEAIGARAWKGYYRFFGDADTAWREQIDIVLFAKFVQHSALREQLFETGTSLIFNEDAYDSVWGIGPGGFGKNHLGKALMRVRDLLLGQGGREPAV